MFINIQTFFFKLHPCFENWDSRQPTTPAQDPLPIRYTSVIHPLYIRYTSVTSVTYYYYSGIFTIQPHMSYVTKVMVDTANQNRIMTFCWIFKATDRCSKNGNVKFLVFVFCTYNFFYILSSVPWASIIPKPQAVAINYCPISLHVQISTHGSKKLSIYLKKTL